MKNKLLATLGSALLGLVVSASASFAGYLQPGETMGVSLASPLPEGVFFANLTDYGQSDTRGANIGVPGASLGFDIPVIIWSTPFSFYNNRLEIIAAFPFVNIRGSAAQRLGAITYAVGPMLARDFGGGLTGGLVAIVRSPDPSQNFQALVPGAGGGPTGGRRDVGADFRQSLQYVMPAEARSAVGSSVA